MADRVLKLVTQFTEDEGAPVRLKLVDNGDGTHSIAAAVVESTLGDGAATAAKQDTTNIKLDELIELGVKAYTKLIDDTTETDVTYIGLAEMTGAAINEGAAVWRIKKIDETGAVTSIKWADGDTGFNNVWNNRTSLDYF